MRKRNHLAIAALICALSLLLSGCNLWSMPEDTRSTLSATKPVFSRHQGVPDFSEMVYVRPDLDQYTATVQSICAQAAEEGADAEALTDSVQDLYDLYDEFYTMETLANIHYCLNLRDDTYETEYNYCLEQESVIEQGVCQALGKGGYSLVISLLRFVVLALPLAWVLSLTEKAASLVWLSLPVAEAGACLVAVLLTRKTYRRFDTQATGICK